MKRVNTGPEERMFRGASGGRYIGSPGYIGPMSDRTIWPVERARHVTEDLYATVSRLVAHLSEAVPEVVREDLRRLHDPEGRPDLPSWLAELSDDRLADALRTEQNARWTSVARRGSSEP